MTGVLWAAGVTTEIIFMWFMEPWRRAVGSRNLLALGGAAAVARWTALAFSPPYGCSPAADPACTELCRDLPGLRCSWWRSCPPRATPQRPGAQLVAFRWRAVRSCNHCFRLAVRPHGRPRLPADGSPCRRQVSSVRSGSTGCARLDPDAGAVLPWGPTATMFREAGEGNDSHARFERLRTLGARRDQGRRRARSDTWSW